MCRKYLIGEPISAKKSQVSAQMLNPKAAEGAGNTSGQPGQLGSVPMVPQRIYSSSDLAKIILAFLASIKRCVDTDDIIDLEDVEFDPNVSSTEWNVIKSSAQSSKSSASPGQSSINSSLECIHNNIRVYKVAAGESFVDAAIQGRFLSDYQSYRS